MIVADWLFFRHVVGVSFSLFLAFLALACACMNPPRASDTEIKLAVGVLAAGLAALVYDFNILSLCFGCAALALYSQILMFWPPRQNQTRPDCLAVCKNSLCSGLGRT